MGVIGRIVRSTVLEILSQEFPTALQAKGLQRRRMVLHVLKNAAPPALAVMGLQLGFLLGGSLAWAVVLATALAIPSFADGGEHWVAT